MFIETEWILATFHLQNHKQLCNKDLITKLSILFQIWTYAEEKRIKQAVTKMHLHVDL